jgi:NADH dehydrogenase
MRLLRMKHRAEQALRQTGLEWIVVRPTVFAELWAGIIGDPIVRSGKATIFGRGDNPINFVSVRDLAAVTVELTLNAEPRLVVEAGGPENLTLRQVVDRVAEAAGRTARARQIPVSALRGAGVLLRPLRPDVTGFVEAAISMATTDMSCTADGLALSLPGLQPTPMSEVIRRKFAPNPRTAEAGVPEISQASHV